MEQDLRLLRTFRAVAAARSFTAAAKKLKLTQSSVSQQVIALERDLGTQLFKRSNKYVRLTTAGEIFLQCASQVVDNLDRVRGLLAEQTKTATGHLAIGAPALFCHSLFPTVLGVFHARFPAVALSIFTAEPDSMASRLAHRELDLAVLPFPVRQPSLATVQMGRDELVAVMKPDHELGREGSLEARELRGQPLVVPNPGNKLWAAWDNFLIEAGVCPNIVVETDDLDLAKQMVIQGHGVSVAPRWAVANEVQKNALAVLRLGQSGVYRDWCVAYHHGIQLAGMWRNFLRICSEEMPRLLTSASKAAATDSSGGVTEDHARKT